MTVDLKEKTRDTEWVTLIKEAKELGLTLEEVRDFLEEIQSRSAFR